MTGRQITILVVLIAALALALGFGIYAHGQASASNLPVSGIYLSMGPTPPQRVQMVAARNVIVAACENLLEQRLDAHQLACINVSFQDGRIEQDIAAPLSQSLQQRQAARAMGGSTEQRLELPDTSQTAGMKQYAYLATGAGPHLLLPSIVADYWHGNEEFDPGDDLGRAIGAVAHTPMAPIYVAGQTALVFAHPPLTAFASSPDGSVDIYTLNAWSSMDLDSLIHRAAQALPNSKLTDTGIEFHLITPNAYLLFAGDAPAHSAFGVHRIPMPAGTYWILTGNYHAKGESVTLYRLEWQGK